MSNKKKNCLKEFHTNRILVMRRLTQGFSSKTMKSTSLSTNFRLFLFENDIVLQVTFTSSNFFFHWNRNVWNANRQRSFQFYDLSTKLFNLIVDTCCCNKNVWRICNMRRFPFDLVSFFWRILRWRSLNKDFRYGQVVQSLIRYRLYYFDSQWW